MPDPHEVLHHELCDRYALQSEIGRGGMATVYLARDLRADRDVALKVLDPDLGALGPRRFEREIRLARSLEHPNILPVLDSGTAGPLLWYVTPYVEGETLGDRLRALGSLPVNEAVRIAAEVARGLAHAHARGVVHRDIKPDNILLGPGAVRIADFGVARATTADGEATARLTAAGATVGTPAYMSPEQAAATGDLDGRSDIYSLGCVLFEMLAGRPPFVERTVERLLRRHLRDPAPPLRRLRPDVPVDLERLVAATLSKRPAERPVEAGGLAARLERLACRGTRAARFRIPWPAVAATILVVAAFLVRSCGGA